MEALEFKIQGKMAHFRKYYSNSTALSYYIPPVTTIKGILAGLLGKERDSYYEEFSNYQCSIGIAVDYPLRKITQTMNLLKVESPTELCGKGVHSQNHTEWIVPSNIRTDILSYTIVFVHKDAAIMNALYEKISSLSEGYLSKGIALSLGSAQCLGWITEGKRVNLELKKYVQQSIPIRFAVPVSQIESVCLKKSQSYFSLKKEETITEFDKERYITQSSKKDILISGDGKPILYELKSDTIYWNDGDENIILIGDCQYDLGSL